MPDKTTGQRIHRARKTMRWAQLLARGHRREALVARCPPLLGPARGGDKRIISLIALSSTVERILLHLALPYRPPRVSPDRGPPQAGFDLDQSSPHDWEI